MAEKKDHSVIQGYLAEPICGRETQDRAPPAS
jgi:hypothetical protein